MICRYSKKCNSCQLCNLEYSEQLKLKEKTCRRLLSGICPVEHITPSPLSEGYRNKAQFVYRREGKNMLCGIYKSTTRSMVPVDSCALCTDNANMIAKALAKLFLSFKLRPYDFHTGSGKLKSVVIRENSSGECMAVINMTDSVFPSKRSFVSALKKACPQLVTAVIAIDRDPGKLSSGRVSETLFGDGYLIDTLCGERFIISPTSFYQINRAQTERLYGKAVELAKLSGTETVLDAYCGVGTIGIIASRHAKEVHSVELNPAAIADARKNAKLNGIENIRFTVADSKDYAKELAESGEKINAAFIDPPRAGCTASFLKALSRLKPERIVYISCNPETQARDIKQLGRLGYRAEICYPFDMFPHTKHIESVVLISRIG